LKKFPNRVTTDIPNWRKCARRNFDEILKLIISTKNIDNTYCIICGPLSIQWKSKSTLAFHYRYEHKLQIIDYYLSNIIKTSPEDLQEMMQIGVERL